MLDWQPDCFWPWRWRAPGRHRPGLKNSTVDTGHSTRAVSHAAHGSQQLLGPVRQDYRHRRSRRNRIRRKARSTSRSAPTASTPASRNATNILRGPDFFNARQFPKITFKSQSVRAARSPTPTKSPGTLTLHGVSQPLTVTLKKIGAGKGPHGDQLLGVETSFHDQTDRLRHEEHARRGRRRRAADRQPGSGTQVSRLAARSRPDRRSPSPSRERHRLC